MRRPYWSFLILELFLSTFSEMSIFPSNPHSLTNAGCLCFLVPASVGTLQVWLYLSVCYLYSVSEAEKQPAALPCCCRVWEILWGCSRLSHLIHVIPACLLPLQSTENEEEVWIWGLERVLTWKEGTNLTLRFGICLCLSSFRVTEHGGQPCMNFLAYHLIIPSQSK